jgi:Flp pilus assembly protein TadG
MVTSPRRKRTAGQAMVEFALVVPILFFLLFGVLDGGLLLFVVGSARFASGEAARQETESGNAATADQDSIAIIRGTPLGTTRLGTVTEIDVYRLIEQPDGTLTVDGTRVNKYRLDGSAIGPINWPPASRDVTTGGSEFIGVTIYFTYYWASGRILGQPPLNLNQAFYMRLEPQTY